MTDFYPDKDRLFYPITIPSDGDRVKVIEDPGGANEATVEVELKNSSTLDNTTEYYAYADETPVTTGPVTRTVVDDQVGGQLQMRSIYAEIVNDIETESSNSGNGWEYEITASTPSGSDHTNSGLTVENVTNGTAIQLDFSASDSIEPRIFGWPPAELNSNDRTTASNAIDSPGSRYGVWYSPSQRLVHDKRRKVKDQTQASSPHKRHRQLHHNRDRHIMRPLRYLAVAGVHVWPNDRAGKQAEADRGGVPLNDDGNALEYLWREGKLGRRWIVVGHGDGEEPLASTVTSAGTATTSSFDAGRLTTEWSKMWAPQDDQEFDQHAGERYDLQIQLAMADPDAIQGDSYRH